MLKRYLVEIILVFHIRIFGISELGLVPVCSDMRGSTVLCSPTGCSAFQTVSKLIFWNISKDDIWDVNDVTVVCEQLGLRAFGESNADVSLCSVRYS